MSEFRDFTELKDAGLFEDQEHTYEEITDSEGRWGFQLRAVRDWIQNKVTSLLHTSIVRPVAFETERSREAITGVPEELVRTFKQRPALFSEELLDKIMDVQVKQSVASRRPVFVFGRPFSARPIKRIPCGVYPTSLGNKMVLQDADRMVLCIVGVPGHEDDQLDGTGMLGKGLIFRWMSPDTVVSSYDEYATYWLRFKTMTVKRTVPTSEVSAFKKRMAKVSRFLKKREARMSPVLWHWDDGWHAWTEGDKPENVVRCKPEFHWRLNSHPTLVDMDDLALLPEKLDELEWMLAIPTLDPDTGYPTKVGDAYDPEIWPELPMEISKTAGTVPTRPGLDPYTMHMYKTEENRTLRELTEARQQLHHHGGHGSRWVEVMDRNYPEHDVDDIKPGGGFYTDPKEPDYESVPAFKYRVRDEEVTDKITVNLTRIWLKSTYGPIPLGDNRNEIPQRNWWRYVQMNCMSIKPTENNEVPWEVTKKHYMTSWSAFHDAIAWLVRHHHARMRFEYDRRVDIREQGVFLKPAGVDSHPLLPGKKKWPTWAVAQPLIINTNSDGMGTKARIFGVPAGDYNCYRLMKGKPLALYQVGVVTWPKSYDDRDIPSFTYWGTAKKVKPIQRFWLNGEIDLTPELCEQLGLNPELMVHSNKLGFNVMNELPARAHTSKVIRLYNPKPLKPTTRKGIARGPSSGITEDVQFIKTPTMDWSKVRRIEGFDPTKDAHGQCGYEGKTL